MSLLVALILGGLVGWLASRLGGRDEGIIGSVVIGVIGALIGSLVSQLFVGSDQAVLAFTGEGLFWSLIGAVMLVALLNAVQRRSRGTV